MEQDKISILVVDDDEALVELVVDLLEDEGFDVTQSATFAKANSLLETIVPSVLMTDLNLDDGDGISLAKIYKEKAQNGKVILLTGDVELGGDSNCIDKVISKPFNVSSLSQDIKDLIKT